MRPLTPLESRLLAVLLALAVLAGLALAAYLPYRMVARHYDEAIESRLDHIARYRRVAGQRAEVEKAIAMVGRKDAKRFYLKSSSPALAAADIQQVAQTLVEAHGLRLESMQIAPHKDENGLRRISLNLRLRGRMEGVQAMLYALETTQPYLFVDNLNLQTTVRQNYVPASGVDPEVTVQFDLAGYALVKKSDVPPRR